MARLDAEQRAAVNREIRARCQVSTAPISERLEIEFEAEARRVPRD
jgi:hypothetical protein